MEKACLCFRVARLVIWVCATSPHLRQSPSNERLTVDIRTYLSEEARSMQAESLQALPAPADWPQARKEWLAQYYAMMA